MNWKNYTTQEADARLRAALARSDSERVRELWLAEVWGRLARRAAAEPAKPIR